MKLFGTLSELVATVFRKDTRAITLRPNQAVTYTASTDVQLAPTTDTTQVLVEIDATQTLTNKTLTSPTLTAPSSTDGSFTSVDTFSLDDTDSAFNLAVQSTSTLTANRTLTLDADDGNRTLELSGDLRNVGGNSLTLTTTGVTNVTTPNTGTLATLAGTEVFTNKDIDGGTASNTSRITLPKAAKATLDGLTRKEATLWYASDLDKLYADNGSSLFEVGSGSSGELNLVESPSDAVGWTETGTVFATPVTTTTAGDLPLGGTIDTAIQFVATGNGTETTNYNSYTMTPGEALKNRKLKVDIWMRPGSGFVSGEWTVSVYNTAGPTRMALSTDSSGATTLPNQTGKFTTTFDADSSTGYTLRFARTSGSGSATLNVAGIVVGPGIQPQGAVVGEWAAYTPTYGAGWGTTTNSSFYWRRVGDSIELQGKFTSGTTTGGSSSIGLPSSYTVGSYASTQVIGDMWTEVASDNTRTIIATSGNAYVAMSRAYTASDIYSELAPNNIGAGPFDVAVHATVLISQLQGSGTLNVAQNDVEYAYNTSTTDANDTTAFAYGPGGGQFGNFTAERQKRVRLQTPFQSSDRVELQVSLNAGVTWAEVGEIQSYVQNFHTQNGVTYGAGLTIVNSTDIDANFGQYRHSSGATFGAAGTNWSSIDADPNFTWRIVKTKAGQAAGFGIATSGSAGLVTTSAPREKSRTNYVSGANYTITDTDGYDTILVVPSGADRTILLPALANNYGRTITVKKVSSGTNLVIVDGNASETIEGALTTFPLAMEAQSVTLRADQSTNTWQVIAYPLKYRASVSTGSGVASTSTTTRTEYQTLVPPYAAVYRITTGRLGMRSGTAVDNQSQVNFELRTGGSAYGTGDTLQLAFGYGAANRNAAFGAFSFSNIDHVLSLASGATVRIGHESIQNAAGTGIALYGELHIEELYRF